MPDQRTQIAQELDRLVEDGDSIHLSVLIRNWDNQEEKKKVEGQLKKQDAEARKKTKGKAEDGPPTLLVTELIKEDNFGSQYQRWYSKAMRVIEQLLPDRYQEFKELYRFDKRPKELDVTTYTVSDYIHGTVVSRGGVKRFDPVNVGMGKMKDQIDILASARDRLDSILADIEGSLEATLLDDELATANELLKAKHVRSAGAVAGVALERHLKAVADNHGVSLGRKKPQIGSLNDALKEARVFDNPRWREVQRLGDIRNLCAHDGEREPKTEEVRELIESTERIIKTVF
jgi:hypothetical protein